MADKTREDNQDGDNKPNKPTYFDDLAIKITRSVYVKISTISVLILFAISATWTIAQLIINQKDSLLDARKQDLAVSDEKLKDRNKKFAELEEDFREIKKLSKVPVLLNPVAGKHITGRFITFRWKYDSNPGFQNFILELKQITKDNIVLKRRYQIPEPQRKKMDFELTLGTQGEFFWRIGTGELLAVDENKPDDKDNPLKKFVDASVNRQPSTSVSADTHLWSRYGNFFVHKSVYDKIKSTGEMMVGMTATFLSYDHTLDCQGRPNTYDMEFIEWIAQQLSKDDYMGVPIKVVRKIFTWHNLLDEVGTGEADIAIAGITKSVEREHEHKDMRFTDGYRTNYQRLIFSKGRLPGLAEKKVDRSELQRILSGKTLATQTDTINQKSAKVLEQIFNFKNDSSFSSYVDVIDAVRRGTVDFGMIDSVRLDTVAYPEIGIMQFDFNPLLEKFYKENLGSKSGEVYAIAVHTNSASSKLIDAINKIITSKEGIAKRHELEKKHKYTNTSNRSIDC